MLEPSILLVGCAKYVNSNEQCAWVLSSENDWDSIPFLENLINSPGETSRINSAPIAEKAEDSEATICTLPSFFSPKTSGRKPHGSRAA